MGYEQNPYLLPQPSTQQLRQTNPYVNIAQTQVSHPGTTDARQTARGAGGGGGGIDAGGYAGMIGAGVGLATDAINQANTKLGLDDIPTEPSQINSDDAPVYTGGSLMIQAANARPKGASGGDILKAAGTGAMAGAATGTPIGVAIGAVVGAGSALIGGGIKKKRQKRERSRNLTRANAAAKDFNTSDEAFRNKQAAMEDYRDQTNNSARLYNLYRQQF